MAAREGDLHANRRIIDLERDGLAARLDPTAILSADLFRDPIPLDPMFAL